MKRLIILGSTGSIGTQTLDVIRTHPGEFEVIGLSSYKNKKVFNAQIKEFKPKYSILSSESENAEPTLMDLAALPEADLIINAITGVAGLLPTYASCKAGKKIALANKESLVMAWEVLMDLCKKTGAEIIPIDSELSALWQMLRCHCEEARHGGPTKQSHAQCINQRDCFAPLSGARNDIEKLILTASGGPFWGFSQKQLQNVTSGQAVKHPTWNMGQKVSIDSATLMNKAFEIIETRWLFDIPPEKIDVAIHRQSIVHALVQWIDGNMSAVLSVPDMRIPISYALFYPVRRKNTLPRLDISKLNLTFEKPDYSLFEGPKLAYEVLRKGGIMPAVLCMADEIAVNKFLRGEISFLGIYDIIKDALENIKNIPFSIEALKEIELRMIPYTI